MGDALADVLGVRGVVEKARRLLLWRTVRIHLDRVAGLGDFVEHEAVEATAGGLEAERDRLEELRAGLGLEDRLIVARGYADLLERAGLGSAG